MCHFYVNENRDWEGKGMISSTATDDINSHLRTNQPVLIWCLRYAKNYGGH